MRKGVLFYSLVSLLVFCLFFSSKPADAKLIAAWLFDDGAFDKAIDASENGSDGVLVGGPEWVEGKFGKALKVDENKYVDFPPPTPEILLLKRDVSWMAWVKPEKFRNAWNVVFSMQRGSSNGEVYALSLGGSGNMGHLIIFVNTVLGNFSAIDAAVLETDKWVHAAGTYDGKKAILYKNGEPVAETAVTGDLNHEDRKGRFVINGNYNSLNGGLAEWIIGIIDEVLIFDTALSATELKNYMQKGLNVAGAAIEPKGKLAQTWGDIKQQ